MQFKLITFLNFFLGLVAIVQGVAIAIPEPQGGPPAESATSCALGISKSPQLGSLLGVLLSNPGVPIEVLTRGVLGDKFSGRCVRCYVQSVNNCGGRGAALDLANNCLLTNVDSCLKNTR